MATTETGNAANPEQSRPDLFPIVFPTNPASLTPVESVLNSGSPENIAEKRALNEHVKEAKADRARSASNLVEANIRSAHKRNNAVNVLRKMLQVHNSGGWTVGDQIIECMKYPREATRSEAQAIYAMKNEYDGLSIKLKLDLPNLQLLVESWGLCEQSTFYAFHSTALMFSKDFRVSQLTFTHYNEVSRAIAYCEKREWLKGRLDTLGLVAEMVKRRGDALEKRTAFGRYEISAALERFVAEEFRNQYFAEYVSPKQKIKNAGPTPPREPSRKTEALITKLMNGRPATPTVAAAPAGSLGPIEAVVEQLNIEQRNAVYRVDTADQDFVIVDDHAWMAKHLPTPPKHIYIGEVKMPPGIYKFVRVTDEEAVAMAAAAMPKE